MKISDDNGKAVSVLIILVLINLIFLNMLTGCNANDEQTKKPPVKQLGKAEFVKRQLCIECHEEDHEDWSGTRHAGAFETLVIDGEADNPVCYPCHTVGFGHTRV